MDTLVLTMSLTCHYELDLFRFYESKHEELDNSYFVALDNVLRGPWMPVGQSSVSHLIHSRAQQFVAQITNVIRKTIDPSVNIMTPLIMNIFVAI